MLSLKRPLFGIFWFCIFSACLIVIACTAFALKLHGNGIDQTVKTINAVLSQFLRDRLNTVSLPLFLIVLAASVKGWLPGTKPAVQEIDKNDHDSRFGFSDALAVVVYLMVIQTGLGFLQGTVFETIGMPQIARTPAARCMLGGLASILLALFALKWFRVSAGGILGSVWHNFPVAPALVLLVAGNALIESEIDNMQKAFFQYPDFLQKAMEDMLNQGVLSLFLLVVIAPLAEEIVFRGIILRLFLQRLPAARAIIISAIIFSCAHMDPLSMLPAFGSGILLGWLYWETRNLWLCIGFHSAHNLLSFAVYHDYLPLHLTGFTRTAVDKIQFQPVWLDILGIVLLLAGIAAARAVAKRNGTTEAVD